MISLLKQNVAELGAMARLLWEAFKQSFRRPFERDLWMDQMYELGVKSVTIANLTVLFTGMVLAIQTAHSLRTYGGEIFLGDIVSLSIVRELGPVLTALVVAGRVGAGITAELGTMAVTEQVDALRVLAASPVKKLVVPRVGALMIVLPLLTALSIAMGIFGGMIMATLEIGQTKAFYMDHVLGALVIQDIFAGVGKTVFFAVFIGIIACHNGLHATGGADGVGKATTSTVVMGSISVIVSDFFLTKIFMMF